VPPDIVSDPPAPPLNPLSSIEPLNVLLAAVILRLLLPSFTVPAPLSVVINDDAAVAPEISNVPLSMTPVEDAIAPLPVRASVPPLLIVVVPV